MCRAPGAVPEHAVLCGNNVLLTHSCLYVYHDACNVVFTHQ